MDNIYGNSEIVFSHLEGRQDSGFFKGSQDIYANTVEQESGGKQRSSIEHTGSSPPLGAEKSGAPCRHLLVLLAVLYLALLAGLIALGILYVQKSNRSDSLEERNRTLSVSLAGTERKLEELLLRYENLTDTLSAYRAKDGCVCLEGWRIHQGSCYFFSSEKVNWLQSQEYCMSKGTHLVIIKNQQEQDFLSSSIRETHWIGLNDRETEGRWVWVDNTTVDSHGTQHWFGKEPDNWAGAGDPNGEDCCSLGDQNGNLHLWFDASCGKSKKFVCETQPRI
ncbi:CD209 antigen-like protein E [Conger conger]|uniref:CD209 antigen-like protein E n=1 Tax=Conger conger TaxID=82655 RepID=UPI002A5A3F71|nr:CD209 antigen-like protein E [Conger conger]